MSELRPVSLALHEGLRRYVSKRVRPEHVDDLVQDILLKMHERAPELREEQRLAGWAFRIAQTVVADHHRQKRPELREELEVPDERDDGNVNEVVAGWLRPMLALLPTEYEEAVEAVDVLGLTHREYAERAGISVSGAKSRVQRGRRMLEEVVRGCCDLELDVRGNVIGYERRGASACEPTSKKCSCT